MGRSSVDPPIPKWIKDYYKSPNEKYKSFGDPETLWVNFAQYILWSKKNPIETNQPNFKNGTELVINKERPLSLERFCTFMGVSVTTFNNYRAKDAFTEVCEYIEQSIFAQNFEMAAIREYDASIIMRKLGLADKKEEKKILELPILNVLPIENTTKQIETGDSHEVIDIESIELPQEKPLDLE